MSPKSKSWSSSFKELEKFILSLPEDSIINLRLRINREDGLEIISARKEDRKYLSHLGNSEDSPLNSIYSEKFVAAFGRLGKRKGTKKDE